MVKNILDSFFELGNKATKGDPVRKAQFDYNLYWIVFCSFVFLAGNYFYRYFFDNAPISSVIWGIILSIFCWFNYWGLVAFRGIYKNMKQGAESLARLKEQKQNPFDESEMMKGFEKEE